MNSWKGISAFASNLWILFVFVLVSCASKRTLVVDKDNNYIVVGRLINHNTSIELRQLTTFYTSEIIIDETIKGKIKTIEGLYPNGKISSISELICQDKDANCVKQQVGTFGYFKSAAESKAGATIIKTDNSNNICEQVILLFNNVEQEPMIMEGQEGVRYNLGMVNFIEVSEEQLQKNIRTLKKISF